MSYRSFFKPLFDIVLSALALMILSPVFIIISIMLSLANKGTPFFTLIRPGKHARAFRVIKFKTMSDQRDEHGELLPDEVRLTPVGRLVRKTSLDEIPQLLSVIQGDMSLIGPRPLLMEYLPLYSKEQQRRHDVRPGITGWAQVNGRNAISWKQKFDYDIWYVEHLSFSLDVKILLQTILKVFKAEGITSATSVTMEKFKGNE